MSIALHPLAAFLERLALLVESLGHCITTRRGWERRDQAFYDSALLRVQRLFASVQRAVLFAASGRVRPAPPAPPQAAARDGQRRRILPPGEVALPQGSGWLVRLVPGNQVYGSALADLLEDPNLPASLANSSAARRSLRSLCVMLGVKPPPFLQTREKAPQERDRTPADAAPERAPPAAVARPAAPRAAGDPAQAEWERERALLATRGLFCR